MGIPLTLLLLMVLTGCTPYWVRNDAYGSCRPVQVQIEYAQTKAEALARCGLPANSPVLGCAIRLRDMPGGPGAVVILSPEAANACGLAHELKHAAGWKHDDRGSYSMDCG